MKLLVDVNLTPEWVSHLAADGVEAVHWCAVGAAQATDEEVMSWARNGGWTVFTHDMDFGRLLAIAALRGPSVVQVRTQDVMPATLGPRLARILREHAEEIELGAIVVIDDASSRLRLLPIRSRS